MSKIAIKPAWQFVSASGEHVDPRVFQLLRAIHDTGKLTLAAKQVGISYRHAWDLLSRWGGFFGSPLVAMARGKGTNLSPLGEKLLWAARRSDASLSPHLENIASELNLEINKYFRASEAVIRIHASHGYVIEKIPALMREHGRADVDLQYMGSVDALRSLVQSTCDLAGFHAPLGKKGASLWKHYAPWIQPDRQRIIRLVVRTQGLVVAKGNPLRIRSLEDLTRRGVRFVNRQRGSGTRILLDEMLDAASIDSTRIQGYDTGEFTHAAIAAYVASGMADVGMGVEAAARQFKLDFIPVVKERYMLACRVETLSLAPVAELVGLLQGKEFQRLAEAQPGYALDRPGTIARVGEVFPWIDRHKPSISPRRGAGERH